MIGTVAQPSWLARVSSSLSAVDRAFKAGPPDPASLYPPSGNAAWLPISWPGWPAWEAQYQRGNTNGIDEGRAKIAVQSPWVFSDITAIANEASAAELVVKERVGEKLEDVANHPLEVLWESPNEHIGRSQLVAFWCWSYTLASKAYLYWMPDSSGQITEVWPIPPFMIVPIPHPKDFITGYAFKGSPQDEPTLIPKEYVTFSHSTNIFDIRDGLSFLVSAMLGIETDIAAAQWNRNFFKDTNAVPDGLITIPRDTLDGDLMRVRQEIHAFFAGTRRGVAVARAGDMDYKPFGRSQKDAEFLAGRQFSEKEIDRTLGFPQGYWSERANRANAEQARATMISGAVWPLLVRLAEDMNAQTVRRWWGPNLRAEFKDIRPEDRSLKLKETAARKEYWILDELREADGKPPIGDYRGKMLIAEIAKGAPLPTTPAAQEQQEEQQAIADEQAAAQAAAQATEASDVPEEPTAPEAPADEAPPMAEAAPTEEAPPADEELMPTKAVDMCARHLLLWEAKAARNWKRFGKAAVKFESDYIPLPEQARIAAALSIAQTTEDIAAAFKATKDGRRRTEDDTHTLIDDEWHAATAWAGKMVEGKP